MAILELTPLLPGNTTSTSTDHVKALDRELLKRKRQANMVLGDGEKEKLEGNDPERPSLYYSSATNVRATSL